MRGEKQHQLMPGRLCSVCGKLLGRNASARVTVCRRCRNKTNKTKRDEPRPERPCAICRAPLPPERRINTCVSCRKKERIEASKTSECIECGKAIAPNRTGYCREHVKLSASHRENRDRLARRVGAAIRSHDLAGYREGD
jgi:hypothetical protein